MPSAGPEIAASPLASGSCAPLPPNTDGSYLIDVLNFQTLGTGWSFTVCDVSGDGICCHSSPPPFFA